MSTFAVANQEQTLKNLLTAFNGETNASARYMAFAVKADLEGFLKVGCLFRAVSRSEQIHAANHAAIIHKMGGVPHSTIDPSEVKSTIENLKAAIAGELFEVKEMYPAFMHEAETAMLPKARRTFRYAFESEKDHVKIFQSMLEHLEHPDPEWRGRLMHKSAYYVCPECGFTATQSTLDHCPVCNHARDEFELID
ncbi:MAG: ferritin family protein [Candidatus Korobacteraceae bacterium]